MRLALALALAATPALAAPEWAAGLVPVTGEPGHYFSGERVADYSRCAPEDGCGVKGGPLRMIDPAPVLVCDPWQTMLLGFVCIPALGMVLDLAPDAPAYGFTVVGGQGSLDPSTPAPSPLRPDAPRRPEAPPAGPPPQFFPRVVPLPTSGALFLALLAALRMSLAWRTPRAYVLAANMSPKEG